MMEAHGPTRHDGNRKGGRVAEMSIDARTAESDHVVVVRTPLVARLRHALESSGAAVEVRDDGSMVVSGLGIEAIGDIAGAYRIAVHELSPHRHRPGTASGSWPPLSASPWP